MALTLLVPRADYGFEYSDDEPEEEDVDIENQYYNAKGAQLLVCCAQRSRASGRAFPEGLARLVLQRKAFYQRPRARRLARFITPVYFSCPRRQSWLACAAWPDTGLYRRPA